MIRKILRYLFVDMWDTRSEYQQKDIETMENLKEFRKQYPSLRITARSISIDPKEIINSDSYKKDLENCHKMIDRINKK